MAVSSASSARDGRRGEHGDPDPGESRPASPHDVHVLVRGTRRRGRLSLPDGPAVALVVFVHGSGSGTADGFGDYAARFAGLGIACLVVDKVMEGYTAARRRYGRLAADCHDVLRWTRTQDALDGVPTALLGYSEGSWVATRAAARHPDLVDLLVLCSAPLTRPRTQTAYHRANADPHLARPIRALRYASTWAVMAALTDYGNEDVGDDLAAVPAPVVLVLGADDPTIDVPRASAIFARTRPDGPAPILVPQADHHLPADGAWLRQVADVLTGLAGTTHPE